jgi:hypothetical protein
MMDVALPSYFNNSWIRRIQGTGNQIAIQLAYLDGTIYPSTPYDNGVILVDFVGQSATTFLNWSAVIQSQNIFYASTGPDLTNPHYAVSRISGPYWFVKGTDLKPELLNSVTISCIEQGVNGVSITSEFYNSKVGTNIDINFRNPFIDITQNTFMALPLDFQSINKGNNLDFTFESSTPDLTANAFKFGQFNIVFNAPPSSSSSVPATSSNPNALSDLHPTILGQTPTPNNYTAIMYVEGSGAATVDSNGNLLIWNCDLMSDYSCNPVNVNSVPIQGDISEVLQESAFGSASFQAYTNTYKMGGSKK